MTDKKKGTKNEDNLTKTDSSSDVESDNDLVEALQEAKVEEVNDEKDYTKKSENKPKNENNEKELDFSFVKYIAIGALIILVAFLAFNYLSSEDPMRPQGKNGVDYSKYNGFDFNTRDNFWITKVQKDNMIYELAFRNHPYDLENVSLTGKLGFLNNYDFVYVTFNPDINATNFSITYPDLFLKISYFEKFPIAGVTKYDERAINDYGAKVVSCDNETLPVIFINQEDGSPNVEIVGNCITINGNDNDLQKASERLLYRMYNIME